MVKTQRRQQGVLKDSHSPCKDGHREKNNSSTVSSCYPKSMPSTYTTVGPPHLQWRKSSAFWFVIHYILLLQLNKHIYSIILLHNWHEYGILKSNCVCFLLQSSHLLRWLRPLGAPSQNKLRYKTSMWHLIKAATLIKGNTEPLFSSGFGAPQAVWHPSYCCHQEDVVRDTTFCFLYSKSFWVASQHYCGFAAHTLPIPPTYPRMDFPTTLLHSASVRLKFCQELLLTVPLKQYGQL